MGTLTMLKRFLIIPAVSLVISLMWVTGPAGAASQMPGNNGKAILLTVVLKHDQSKPLPEIKRELARNHFFDHFPPKGTQVVSWYVMMGLGQVITLSVPPARLRAVNTALENGAWGPFRTEFYPTYDFSQLWKKERREVQNMPAAGGH